MEGHPVRVCELLAQIEGAAYVVRRTAINPREVRRLRTAVRNAFRVQMAGLGYSLVEVVSNCPTNWGLTPQESLEFVEEEMLAYYPLGDYKVKPEVQALLAGAAATEREHTLAPQLRGGGEGWGEA
jgi:2-oxoglutarate ferredoxin oxidoreductase subunit beta